MAIKRGWSPKQVVNPLALLSDFFFFFPRSYIGLQLTQILLDTPIPEPGKSEPLASDPAAGP